MALSILIVFVLAAAAPWLHRALGRHAGWLLALAPAGVVAWAVRQIDSVAAGGTVRESYRWAEALDLRLSLAVDGLSLVFLLLIAGIGALVVIYAGGYFGRDRRLGGFYTLILLFMGSMLGVVSADNVITLFIFWELTSVSSYLLIGFEHERLAARKAALMALLVTGLGGLALLAGLLMLGMAGGSFELTALMDQGDLVRGHPWYLPILLLVAIGAFTKSAQMPFHFWLPGAMEAPTPVSAYLHSATMVKAGVYLLARVSPILGGTDAWTWLIAPVGAATAVVAAWIALQGRDLKLILAYSTVSVLGTLTMLLGLGAEGAIVAACAMLLAHGMYKGAMFLIAGAVYHQTHSRDVEALGGLWRRMPATAAAAGLAALSMAGVAPTFGFLAKELYYEAALHHPVLAGAWTAAAVAAGVLTVAVVGLVFFKPFFGPLTPKAAHAHEASVSLWLGPAALSALGVAVGIRAMELAGPLTAAAASAIAGRPIPVKLTLWHGWNLTLALSLATLAAGVLLYLLRGRIPRAAALREKLAAVSPTAGYHLAIDSLNFLARTQTRFFQSGYLRYYLLIILLTTIGLIAAVEWRGKVKFPEWDLSGIEPHELTVVLLIFVAAIAAVRTQSRLAAVAALGVVGYGMAALFVFYSAPDLAMTQFVIETLTVILFVLIFFRLPDSKNLSRPGSRIRDLLVAGAAGASLAGLLLLAKDAREFEPISAFFVENSVAKAHGRNIVNVILVDFRALDTLGEITVLAIAGLGAYTILRLRPVPKPRKEGRAAAEAPAAATPLPGAAPPPAAPDEGGAPWIR